MSNLGYGAVPARLEDVTPVVPAAQLGERRPEFPNLQVIPMKFAARELRVKHWSFLIGAVGNQALYIRQLKQILRDLRRGLTLDALRQGVDQSRMSDNHKDLALTRLSFAADYTPTETRSKICSVRGGW